MSLTGVDDEENKADTFITIETVSVEIYFMKEKM